MKRRSFFGGLVGGAAAALGLSRPVVAAEFDPTVPSRRDAQGDAVCRVYRESEDDRTGRRVWVEIRIEDIRVGDRIIRVGQNGPRLWCADAMTVTAITPVLAATGLPGVQTVGDVDLRVNPAETPPADVPS